MTNAGPMSQHWKFGRFTGYADVDPADIPTNQRMLEIRCRDRSRRGELVGVVINGGAGWLFYARMEEGQPAAGPWHVECRCGRGHDVDPSRLWEVTGLKQSRARKDRAADVRSVAPRNPT